MSKDQILSTPKEKRVLGRAIGNAIKQDDGNAIKQRGKKHLYKQIYRKVIGYVIEYGSNGCQTRSNRHHYRDIYRHT